VSLKLTLVDSPDIEETLRQAALGSDLLVMASTRRGFFRQLWATSIVEGLRRHLQTPLLLVRGYPYPVDLTADPIPEHILVPLDGSATAESVIVPATTISRLNDTALTLLNVHQSTWTSDSLEQMVPHSYLESIADRLKRTLSAVDTRILPVDGSIGSAVAEYAQKCLANWIAVGTHRDGGLRRLVRGSIADTIVRKTNLPVLMTGSDVDSTAGLLAVVG
jgi:nucleotide-binding universal stress UspA family protein